MTSPASAAEDPPPSQPTSMQLVSCVPLYDAELSAPKSRVCVTGATGYLAGPIIERLLRAGHIVNATCRWAGSPVYPPGKGLQERGAIR